MAANGSVALPPSAQPPPPPPYFDISAGHPLFSTPTQQAHAHENEDNEEPLPRYFPPFTHFQRLSGLLLPLFLLPLSLLLLVTLAPDESMSGIGSFFKGILGPALIALTLYLTLHFALLPLYRRHRARYSQYLPVATQNPLSSSLTSSASGLRERLSSSILVWLLPSRWAEWRYANRRGERVHNAEDGDNDDDEEMGEDLDFDVEDAADADGRERRRRDGLSLSIDARHARDASSDRRLSRELEEGFADSSDEEDEPRHDRRR